MEEYLRNLKTHINNNVMELDKKCDGTWDFDERRILRKIASMLDDVLIEINRNVPQE